VSIAEGQSIGNYTVLSRLGVGGMGAVYLAEHPLIGKKVALKVIHGELAANKEVVQRFFNEARAVNKIGNEHVVEIHDFGQSPQGEYFYIMEYLEGRTLADVLVREGALLTQRALHIAAQIASALAAAHTCGIIHRDLKPDNIMLLDRLGDRDFVKVLDFGLAKMIHDGASAKLTAAGVVLGTPQYMSPEACESKRDIDHRSDIYCLGILLFQMVCGRVPFEGQSMGEILVKHVSQAPPAARAINPQVPPAVEQIILRCLAKRPDDRFPTMKAMRDALLDADAYLASGPPVMPAAAVLGPQEKTMFPGAVNAQQVMQHLVQQAAHRRRRRRRRAATCRCRRRRRRWSPSRVRARRRWPAPPRRRRPRPSSSAIRSIRSATPRQPAPARPLRPR
jgi:eukaryotic-like serine/threonine-protein kinase